MTNQPAAELAAKLASLAPGSLNHVMFGCGGSTAIDSAYRLIQFYQNCRGKPEKKHVIARDASYHGTTYLAMSKIHDIGADNIAAFFAEPIPGAGGVIVPPEGYHRRTWELCKANDILYVSDEVVTAFGRLGEWFASDSVFGIKPDIITCAKGLTSGYLPLGATLYSDEIHNVISEPGQGRYFAHGFTYSGHPVSCAAALKNIEIMERENLFEHARDVGGYFEKRIRSLQDLPIVGQVRGKKLMQCVEFVADKATRKVFPESLDIGKVISDIADKKGLLVRPIINLNVMSPPLVITHDEIDIIIDTLAESIEEATKQLQKSGDWTPPA